MDEDLFNVCYLALDWVKDESEKALRPQLKENLKIYLKSIEKVCWNPFKEEAQQDSLWKTIDKKINKIGKKLY